MATLLRCFPKRIYGAMLAHRQPATLTQSHAFHELCRSVSCALSADRGTIKIRLSPFRRTSIL